MCVCVCLFIITIQKSLISRYCFVLYWASNPFEKTHFAINVSSPKLINRSFNTRTNTMKQHDLSYSFLVLMSVKTGTCIFSCVRSWESHKMMIWSHVRKHSTMGKIVSLWLWWGCLVLVQSEIPQQLLDGSKWNLVHVWIRVGWMLCDFIGPHDSDHQKLISTFPTLQFTKTNYKWSSDGFPSASVKHTIIVIVACQPALLFSIFLVLLKC